MKAQPLIENLFTISKIVLNMNHRYRIKHDPADGFILECVQPRGLHNSNIIFKLKLSLPY